MERFHEGSGIVLRGHGFDVIAGPPNRRSLHDWAGTKYDLAYA